MLLKEIPSTMLEGYEQIENNNVSYQDEITEWKYGNNYENDDNQYYKENNRETFKKFETSRGEVNKQFHFRSADSFLNSLNKGNNIDLSLYKAGVKVYHKKFGQGTINYVEKEDEDLKVDINFDKFGHKRLMAKYAGLEILD